MRITRLGMAGGLGLVAATAVFGSATGITNTVGKLGGSTAAVATCDSSVTTSFTTSYDAGLGEYEVDDVTVSDIDAVACLGSILKVTLSDVGGNALAADEDNVIVVDGTEVVIDFSSSNVPARLFTDVNIVLEDAAS